MYKHANKQDQDDCCTQVQNSWEVHSHTHTHTLSLSHTHSLSLSHTLSLSLTAAGRCVCSERSREARLSCSGAWQTGVSSLWTRGPRRSRPYRSRSCSRSSCTDPRPAERDSAPDAHSADTASDTRRSTASRPPETQTERSDSSVHALQPTYI